jgi:bacillithiol biosynthesis cysteine-adding enzyme BshC
MEFAPVSYEHLPKTAPIFRDFVSHFDRVAEFYSGSPYQAGSYSALANQLHFDDNRRAELAAILTRQNKVFGSGESTFANIAHLKEPGTFAVVTGQQVGLLSGPSFTFYKALTAVRLAQTLSERGLPSVPVFWLATEDHDLAEVAKTATFDEDSNLIELKDEGKRPAPNSPVGRVKLTAEINVALDRLEKSLPATEFRDRLLRDLRESYQPGVLWGQAFGQFIARVFSPWGVVLIDPSDESIHRISAPIYEKVLTQSSKLRERLIERSGALLREGYDAQVHVGDDSTLLFVAQEGNRISLRERGGNFSLDGAGKISASDLQALVKTQPLDFSANALLRPFIQDTLLPTIAYVAGPSEVAYLAQSQVLYSELGRPQPIIFPRAAFTLVDARTQRVMEKYRVSVEDVWQGEEHLKRVIAAHGFAEGWSERLDKTENGLTHLLEELRTDVAAIDLTLLDTLKRTEESMKHQIDRLKGKITRAALEKSELLARHEQALSQFLYPRKQLQEREVSGVYFLGRAGYELLERLLTKIQTDSSLHQIVAY